MKKSLTPDLIESKILIIRGHKVMLDRDLAKLYGVETKVLNQAVKRNIKRFPLDFMFRLTRQEKAEVVTNCDHLQLLKFSSIQPLVFTEQGVTMLACVLNSPRAIKVNIQIVRVFAKLRELIITHKDLKRKIDEMEHKYDYQFKVVFEAIKKLIDPPTPPKPKIGFHP